MANFKKKVEKRAARLGIDDGETVLAACLTDPIGGAADRVKKTTGGGLVYKDLEHVTQGGAGTKAQMLPAKPLILILTNRRLLASKRSAALQQPTETVCSWSLDEVSGLEVVKSGLVYHLTVLFSDESVIRLEAVMVSKPVLMGEAWNSLAR